MFQHATTTNRDRKVTFSFDGPMLDNDEHDSYEWHQRIKVTVTHNAKKKCYEAHVSWCKASERNGYSVEQHAIFTDPYLLLMRSEPVGRYNESKFNGFVTQVREQCDAIVADEFNVSDAATLLRQAQTWYAVAAN